MSSFLTYARLVRLPNVFTAMADIGLGALATGSLPDRLIPFVLLLLASSCLYCSGMVWNDYFDVEQDKRERPFRPLASGKVSRRQAVWIGALLMVGGFAAAALADLMPGKGWSKSMALLLVAAIFLYNGWLKRTWAGPLAMGACRFLNVLLGLSVAGVWQPPGWWGVALALAVGVYIVGVTWFARTEASFSRQNILKAAAGVMALGLVIGLAVPALADEAGYEPQTSAAFPYLLAGFAFFLALPVSRAIQLPVPERVQAAVKRAVLGLIVFDAVLATGLAGFAGLLLLLLLVPGIILGRWAYST